MNEWPKEGWECEEGEFYHQKFIPADLGRVMAEAIREIVDWPNPVGIDDAVNAIGKLTPNTMPEGDLYGPRITTARGILKDALARYEKEVGS